MTDKTAVAYLREARAVFVDHGGAVGEYRSDDGRVCALGALCEIDGALCQPDLSEEVFPLAFVLHDTAEALYGISSIVEINDDLGGHAVLHCYDMAIKTLEEAQS